MTRWLVTAGGWAVAAIVIVASSVRGPVDEWFDKLEFGSLGVWTGALASAGVLGFGVYAFQHELRANREAEEVQDFRVGLETANTLDVTIGVVAESETNELVSIWFEVVNSSDRPFYDVELELLDRKAGDRLMASRRREVLFPMVDPQIIRIGGPDRDEVTLAGVPESIAAIRADLGQSIVIDDANPIWERFIARTTYSDLRGRRWSRTTIGPAEPAGWEAPTPRAASFIRGS